MLKRLDLLTWGVDARITNGHAKMHAADARATAMAPTIRALQAKGLVSLGAIAHALETREIPTAQGGHWHPSGVKRLLQRLQRLEASSRTGVTPDEDAEPK